MSSRARWFALAAAVIVADQLTKWLVMAYFANRAPHEELTGFLNLVLVFNKGAAFSLFAQAPGWQTPLLATFALVAAVIVSVLIVRNPERRLMCLGLALILGGALDLQALALALAEGLIVGHLGNDARHPRAERTLDLLRRGIRVLHRIV